MAKNKMKTHKGAAKRIKLTATGKAKRRKAFHTHNLNTGSKSAKRKRGLRKSTLLSSADLKRIKRAMAK